jgi:hypothetical protein
MSKRKSDAATKRPGLEDLALLSKITVKGQPLGPLSVAKQKKLLEILSTDLQNTGPTSSRLDFESFRMGFLTASVVVRMFICTGGGEAYDDIVKRLEAAESEMPEDDKTPAKA